MVQLNSVNVIRMGLLGGIEASAAAIAEGLFGKSVYQANNNITAALTHLEVIGLGKNEVVAAQLYELNKSGPLRALIESYQIGNGPAPAVDPECYASTHYQALLNLIGALYMTEPDTVRQNIELITEYTLSGSEGITAEDKALRILHASLQLHSGFRDHRHVLNVREADEPYLEKMRQQGLLSIAFRTPSLF